MRRSPVLALPVVLSLLAALAPFAIPAPLGAQSPGASSMARAHSAAPLATAARRAGAVSIDGRLDEAAWQAATPITEFTQLDPQEGQPASERTEARILIDDVAIYVGMRMYDREAELIHRQLARRDEGIEGDLVEVTFDSYHDHLSAHIFRLSPLGARRDATVSENGQDNSWDAVWEGAASVDGEGWTAEFRIPLSQLRFNANADAQTWGLQLGRKIARKAEVSFFSFVPKNQRQGIHTYGHLTGLGKLASPRRLELVPYALAKNENPRVEPGDPFRTRNNIVPGVGLDLKYGITSNLTLDATINPDFGQVEVDPAVVNLTAFETFFPERRPFFVEGAGIFSFGNMRTQNTSNSYTFLHSRRIGRSPQRGIGGADITYVDAPNETTIAGALKLTGRSANGWSVGILDAMTTRETARYRSVSLGDGRATVEPQANYYFAGRVKRELREGNTTVGLGLTAVNRDLGDDELKPLFRSGSYVGGLDWNHAWGNRTWAFDGNLVFSQNIGSAEAIDALQTSPARYFQRPDRKNNHRDPTRTSLTGHLGEFTFAKIAGQHWRGSVSFQDYSPGFDNNELGFLGGTGMRSIAPLISYQETRPGKIFRNWQQFLFWNPTWNYDGELTFTGVGAITTAELWNFWSVEGRIGFNPKTMDDDLTRGGPTARLANGGSSYIDITSDRRKKLTYGLFMNYSWNEAGGRGQSFEPQVTFRPTSALRVTLSPSLRATHAMAQYVTRVADPLATETYGSRYVFATLNQRVASMVTRLDWTFTPALSLQLFAQPLVATADFTDYKEFDRPRRFDFEIYGRDVGTIARDPSGLYTVDPDGAGAAPAFTFADRDFNSRSLRGSAVLRWEYRPGSALFLVWQQSRSGFVPNNGEFDLGNNLDALWAATPENVFVIKGTWWVGR